MGRRQSTNRYCFLISVKYINNIRAITEDYMEKAPLSLVFLRLKKNLRSSYYYIKLRQQGALTQTEEATKNAFVLPFIQSILGYDVFNPLEVMPEYTADAGIKKGEKVDFAILKDEKIQILMECKKYGEELNPNHASQLYRYFSVTEARIAILTNGKDYKFFTDLDAPNKMDNKPFLELDMLDIDENIIPEIKKITKPAFDVDSVINAAGELKYVSQLKKNIHLQFTDPNEELARFFISAVYDGFITQKVKDQFKPLLVKAFQQYLGDQVNDRLKSAIHPVVTENRQENKAEEAEDASLQDNGIVTTQEELDGFNIVKAIACQVIDLKRIVDRDTKSYFGILLDDNNRKPICRLHFNGKKKYLGVFDEQKQETRHVLESLNDIFKFMPEIQKIIQYYLQMDPQE